MEHKFFFVVFLLLLLSKLILSQNISGNLEGRIVDTLGIPISNVNISLQSESLQGIKGSATDNKGYIRIFRLPIGIYNVKISSIGFREVIVENVQISLGKTSNLGEIKLPQQAYELPEITISGERQIIDPTSTTYGRSLLSTDFEQLPIDRDYKSIVTLLPQANTSYYGDEANIGGGTGFENKYFVDGIEVSDPLTGETGTKLPYNFIKEVQLSTGSYNVDTRSSLGGLINAVTNSGTNEFHGSVFGFYTNNKLSENEKLGLLDVTQGDFSNYDFGFGIGGPIIRDKLWFYAAYNPTFNRKDTEVPSFGTYLDKTITHSFAVKINWRASDDLNMVFTTTGDPTRRDAVDLGFQNQPVSLSNPDSYFQKITEGSINYALRGTYTLNKNFFLEGVISRDDRQEISEPASEIGKSEVLFFDAQSYFASGGAASSRDFFRGSTEGKIAGTALIGDHIINAGIEYKTSSLDNIFDQHVIMKYDSFIYYDWIIKSFGKVSNRIPSVFIQDSWRIIPGLTLNFGIRWEDQKIIGTDGNVAQSVAVPLQPRIGIVYLPDNDDKQKFFASYGRFSQEFSLFTSINYHSGNGYEYLTYFDHDPRVSNSGGDTVINFPHVINPEVEGLRGQYFDEITLGYERLIGWKIKLCIQGLYRTLGEAIDDVVLPEENKPMFGNPGRGILSEWPRPQREYTALILSIERRFDERFNFFASYVLSRDYGNYEGLFDAFANESYPNSNTSFNELTTAREFATGLVPNDRTHVFKFSGSYRFPFGLTTGLSFIAQSGTPLSEFAGINYGIKFLSQRGSTGRTPAIWDLNARLIYELPFQSSLQAKLILDVLHIASQREPVKINQMKYLGVDPEGNVFGPNPTYGQAYRYQPSMSVCLGIEVSF